MTGTRLLIAAGLMLGIAALTAGPARAAEENPLQALQGLSVSTEAYINWANADIQGDKSNALTLDRAYLTVGKAVTKFLSVRYTLDVKQASTSASASVKQVPGDSLVTVTPKVSNGLDGNYVFRTKFAYAELKLGSAAFLMDARARVGMQSAGLEDFEASINPYRAQARNWLERAGWFGTADLGVGLTGDLGGKLEDAQARIGSDRFSGRYGSYSLLLANGGNYDRKEANDSKVTSGRITLRPLADALPGLQLTYCGAFGEDNTNNGPSNNGVPFNVNVGMLSYQAPRFSLYGQYFAAKDNQAGTYVVANADPRLVTGLKSRGWSAFGVIKLPVAGDRLAVYGHYSVLDSDKDDRIAVGDHDVRLTTAGASYEVARGNLFIVAYETVSYDPYAGPFTDAGGSLPSKTAKNLANDTRLQVVYRLYF